MTFFDDSSLQTVKETQVNVCECYVLTFSIPCSFNIILVLFSVILSIFMQNRLL